MECMENVESVESVENKGSLTVFTRLQRRR